MSVSNCASSPGIRALIASRSLAFPAISISFKSRQANKLIYLPPNNNNLKIFTETNWSIISRDADSNVIYSAGGPYTLKGNVYTETIETATGQMTQYLHMRPRFRIRVDGDKYYQMGVNQSPLEEIWQRLPQ